MVANEWDPRYPEPLLQFWDAWVDSRILGDSSIVDQIKTQLLLPKMNETVVKWDPLRETIPIHTWIHPWLTILKDILQPLYIPIRQKLMNALQHWHPSDGSAQAILSPWHNVFDEPSWDQVMARCIVPKLLYVMQVTTIIPRRLILL